MEYTILILLLPLASFLVLGLAGMKMRPAAAGAVGTAVLAVVALLSYWTAFEYFSAGRDAAGVFPTLIPWNAVWLPIGGALHIDLGSARPDLGDDARGDLHGVADGPHLFAGLHEGRAGASSVTMPFCRSSR